MKSRHSRERNIRGHHLTRLEADGARPRRIGRPGIEGERINDIEAFVLFHLHHLPQSGGIRRRAAGHGLGGYVLRIRVTRRDRHVVAALLQSAESITALSVGAVILDSTFTGPMNPRSSS